MKILQINAVYGHGSTGTIVRDLADLCERFGILCYVASPDKAVLGAKHGYLIGNKLDHKLHAFFSRFYGRQAYFSRLATKRLLSFIRSFEPDAVHLHNLHSNFINLKLLLEYLAQKRIRVIITLHDCWYYTGGCFHYTVDGCKGWLNKCGVCPQGKKDPIGYFRKKTAANLADRERLFLALPRLDVVGVSDWISNEAKRSFFRNSNVITIHNGIDMDVFKPTPSEIRKRLGLENAYIILGPVSKWLSPINKPVLDYFSANMKRDEILLLFGANSADYKLPHNVKLYGYVSKREDLAALYSCADVFVNTSHEDSLSLINVEAQACGTPVVTFDSTGPKETVDGAISQSIEVGNAKELYRAVSHIRDIQLDDAGTICRQFVNSLFDVNINYKKYIDLYNQGE